MAAAKRYLAIDLGAASGRVVLGTWSGSKLDLEEVHRFPNAAAHIRGGLYTDVLGMWREINDGIARAAKACGGHLDAVGVDTWGVDFALLDGDDALVGNPRQYRDKRTDDILRPAFERVPREEIFAATGVQIWQINSLFQLFSMVRSGSAELDAAKTMLPLPNLFYSWLGAPPCAEFTTASTTQCLDMRTRTWAFNLIRRFGIRTELFPELVEPGTELGVLRDDVAAEAGLRGATRIVAVASHDTASAAAGVPGLDDRTAFMSSGTWCILGMEMPAPVITPAVLEAGFSNEGGLAGKTLLVKTLAGLWLLQECRRLWQRAGRDYSWDELLTLAEAAEPFRSIVDSEASDFMSPDDMTAAIAAFCRRTGQPVPDSPGAMIRCCLESLALRYRITVRELREVTGVEVEALRIVGGGSQNRILCQLAADACGIPVIAGPGEGTAVGNILAQAVAGGEFSNLAQGHAAVAGSIHVATYLPRPSDRWAEADARSRTWHAVAAS